MGKIGFLDLLGALDNLKETLRSGKWKFGNSFSFDRVQHLRCDFFYFFIIPMFEISSVKIKGNVSAATNKTKTYSFGESFV